MGCFAIWLIIAAVADGKLIHPGASYGASDNGVKNIIMAPIWRQVAATDGVLESQPNAIGLLGRNILRVDVASLGAEVFVGVGTTVLSRG